MEVLPLAQALTEPVGLGRNGPKKLPEPKFVFQNNVWKK